MKQNLPPEFGPAYDRYVEYCLSGQEYLDRQQEEAQTSSDMKEEAA